MGVSQESHHTFRHVETTGNWVVSTNHVAVEKNPNRALDPQNMKPVDPQLPETLN
jgi:hypothetical protein